MTEYDACPACGGGLPGSVPRDLVCRCGNPGDGSFETWTRAAIYRAGGFRCIGCGRTDTTCQHRTARGMGGTSRGVIGNPANGVPLCGSGTTGCHGWAEHHPRAAELVGWRVLSGVDPLDAPFWTRFGWMRWGVEDGWWHIRFVYEPDLDRLGERQAAVAEFRAAVAKRPDAPTLYSTV